MTMVIGDKNHDNNDKNIWKSLRSTDKFGILYKPKNWNLPEAPGDVFYNLDAGSILGLIWDVTQLMFIANRCLTKNYLGNTN